jgi:type IV pilus assembly protein PilC
VAISGSGQSAYDPWEDSQQLPEVAPPPVAGSAADRKIAEMYRSSDAPRPMTIASPLRVRASEKTLSIWFRKAGIAMRAGLDVRRFLDTESTRYSGRQQQAMDFIRQRVSAGDTFAEAVRGSGWFPPLACDLIAMGEQAGRLEDSLLKLADYYEHRVKMRQTFWSIVFFPLLQFVAAVLIVTAAIWLIGTLSNGAMLVLGLGGESGAATFAGIVSASVIAILIFVNAVAKGWLGSLPIRIAMKLPVLGDALESFALARLTWGFHAALEAGMEAKKCVEMAFKTTQNPVYLEQIPKAKQAVGNGDEFHVAFRRTGVFPTMFLDAIENGEMAGSLAHVLPRLTLDYEDTGRRNAVVVANAAGYIVWAGVAMFIISMIFSLAQNYLNILNEASKI